MGDLPVSALVNDVVGRLTSEFIKEFSLFRGFKADVLTLKNHFDLIQAVLQDAEKKRSDDMAVELWLQRLKSLSLKVENVLDEISTEALLRRLRKERGIKYRVKDFFSSEHNRFMFRVRSAHKVRAIRRKLDELESERSKLSLSTAITHSHVDDTGVAGDMPNRETSSLIEASAIIFGRNEDLEMVTGKICNKDLGKYANGEILVYGIWGMGGIGKTTLAQLVYNNDRVEQHFDKKCWAFVSENFQVNEILKAIIESLDDGNKCKLTSLDLLQKSLQRKLQGNKFLIVLDDVWIEDENKQWRELRKTLSCGAEGSIVMITTRSKKTSQVLVKVPELQHNLECLSEDDSWSLFKKLAFAEGRVGDGISELESIGREIVEKCQGLPLAVDSLGRLMWTKSSTSDWQRVKNSFIWELKENNVLPPLMISYDNLRLHLKRCFAYCCMFPKGYEMEKDGVIQLWIANGFIPPRGDIDLYEIGEEIFDCLLWRSFFQFHKKYLDKNTYKMHDLMNDMARHVMGNDCLVIEPACKDAKIPNEVLHLSSSSDETFHLSPQDVEKLTSLRSIFMFRDVDNGCLKVLFLITEIFKQVYVRVLHLIGMKYQRLPPSIFFKLKHLKYLNISDSYMEFLPESIIYLQNLEVLILSHCWRLCKLPQGLKYMKSLKYLGNRLCLSLRHLPIGIKELTSLQRLSTFPISKENGAKIEELGYLNLLKGELVIEGLENVGNLAEAKSANIKGKKDLSLLKLQWSRLDEEILQGEREMNKEVLEGLEPNPCLKTLKIFHYKGKTISPSWMLKLRNLVELTFHACKKCERIPPLGRLPKLRVIKLHSMDSLKCFHDDDTNISRDTTNMFLSLEELHISMCGSLLSLPSNLPKLKVLKLIKCRELVSLPAEILKDLNELEIRDCVHLSERCQKENGVDWPKISHIPNIRIDLPSDVPNEDEFGEEGHEFMEILMHLANHYTKEDDGEETHKEEEEIIDAETEDEKAKNFMERLRHMASYRTNNDDGEETQEEGEEIIDAETEDEKALKFMEILRHMASYRTNNDDGEETQEEGEEIIDAEAEDAKKFMEILRHMGNYRTNDDDDGEETHEEGEEIIDAQTEDEEAKKIMEVLKNMDNYRTKDDGE